MDSEEVEEGGAAGASGAASRQPGKRDLTVEEHLKEEGWQFERRVKHLILKRVVVIEGGETVCPRSSW